MWTAAPLYSGVRATPSLLGALTMFDRHPVRLSLQRSSDMLSPVNYNLNHAHNIVRGCEHRFQDQGLGHVARLEVPEGLRGVDLA